MAVSKGDGMNCQVHFCCNNEHGRFRGRFDALVIYLGDRNLELTSSHEDGLFIRFESLPTDGMPSRYENSVRIRSRNFRSVNESHVRHVGNLLWDSVELRIEATKSLIRYLHSLGWQLDSCDDLPELVDVTQLFDGGS